MTAVALLLISIIVAPVYFTKDLPDKQGTRAAGFKQGGSSEKAVLSGNVLYSPERLTCPLKRAGDRGEGKWERISWDEALSTIACRLHGIKKRYGAEAIDFHHGHYHSGDILGTYMPRLANLIGTPNITNPSHVCHLPRVFLQYNIDLGAVFQPDVPHTKCLLLWGGNPRATNKPQEIAIREARALGMKLIVIDPRKIGYAREADIHAQLRPGTDGALALGMLHVIVKENLYDREFVEKWTKGFDRLWQRIEDYPPEKVEEISWVPAGMVREMARMYAKAKPGCISPRNALDQHTNAFCAIRAINILMAITGNLDVKGGNVFTIPVSMGFEDLKLVDKLPPGQAGKKIGADKVLWSRLSDTWPSAHAPSLWDAILNDNPYPVKAMMVMAANPALICANSNVVQEALRKLDFLVVADLFMTSTGEGLKNHPEGLIITVPPFLYTKMRGALGGIVRDIMKLVAFRDYPTMYKKYEMQGFITPSKKVEIYSERLEKYGHDPLPHYREPAESPISRPELAKEYPFILIAGTKLEAYTHSMMRNIPGLRKHAPENLVEIHPESASRLEVHDGKVVKVSSPRGCIRCRARVTDSIDPRVVHLYHGFKESIVMS